MSEGERKSGVNLSGGLNARGMAWSLLDTIRFARWQGKPPRKLFERSNRVGNFLLGTWCARQSCRQLCGFWRSLPPSPFI